MGHATIRKIISLSESFDQKIRDGAKKLGISQSELVRRAVDDYLQKFGLNTITQEEVG